MMIVLHVVSVDSIVLCVKVVIGQLAKCSGVMDVVFVYVFLLFMSAMELLVINAMRVCLFMMTENGRVIS